MESLMETQAGTDEVAQRKRVGSRPVAGRKVYARSWISNGGELLPDIDGRSIVARRYRDIASAILADQGGADQCSESRRQLIRRFSGHRDFATSCLLLAQSGLTT
jgi:hypothetical protein